MTSRSTDMGCPECGNAFAFGHKFSCSKRRNYLVVDEVDPNGVDQHAPGAKLDQGKVEMSLVFEGFPRALLEIGKVSTFGANKYTRNGWMSVPDGEYRYRNAAGRHYLKQQLEGDFDKDSLLYHEAHELWNKLAAFELKLRRLDAIRD